MMPKFAKSTFAITLCSFIVASCGNKSTTDGAAQAARAPLTTEQKASLADVRVNMNRPLEASSDVAKKSQKNGVKSETAKISTAANGFQSASSPESSSESNRYQEGDFEKIKFTCADIFNEAAGEAADIENPSALPESNHLTIENKFTLTYSADGAPATPTARDELTEEMSKRFQSGDCAFTESKNSDKDVSFAPDADGNLRLDINADGNLSGTKCPVQLNVDLKVKVAATGLNVSRNSATRSFNLDASMNLSASMSLRDPQLIVKNDVSSLDVNVGFNFNANGSISEKKGSLKANAFGNASIVSAKHGKVELSFNGSGQLSVAQKDAKGAIILVETWKFADFIAESRLEIVSANQEEWKCTLNGEQVKSLEEAKKYSTLCQMKFMSLKLQ